MALVVPMPLGERLATVQGMRFNGTTSYGRILNAVIPARFSSSEYSGHIVARRRGAHENNAGYAFNFGTVGGDQPLRVFDNDISGGSFAVGRDSATDLAPLRKVAMPIDTLVRSLQFSASNSLLASGISCLVDGVVPSDVTANDGTTALVTTTTGDFWIGNRDTGDRTYNGDIIMLALWRKAITSKGLAVVRTLGPLAMPEGLLLCIVEGKDIGPHKLPIIWSNVGVGDTYQVPLKGY
jgi:hypothetical protein